MSHDDTNAGRLELSQQQGKLRALRKRQRDLKAETAEVEHQIREASAIISTLVATKRRSAGHWSGNATLGSSSRGRFAR